MHPCRNRLAPQQVCLLRLPPNTRCSGTGSKSHVCLALLPARAPARPRGIYVPRSATVEIENPHKLLRDRTAALHDGAGFHVAAKGSQHCLKIYAIVAKEPLVLDTDDRLDEMGRQFVQRLVGRSERPFAGKRLSAWRLKEDRAFGAALLPLPQREDRRISRRVLRQGLAANPAQLHRVTTSAL